MISRFCRADLGWICYFGLANFGKIAGENSQRIPPANFSREFFGLVSPRFQAPPPPKKNSHTKFTPKIAGVPLQFQMFEPILFFMPIFLWGRSKFLSLQNMGFEASKFVLTKTLLPKHDYGRQGWFREHGIPAVQNCTPIKTDFQIAMSLDFIPHFWGQVSCETCCKEKLNCDLKIWPFPIAIGWDGELGQRDKVHWRT